MFLCDLTKYPKLFSNIEWGKTLVNQFNNDVEVFENRNIFVKEFKIINNCSMPRYIEKSIETIFNKNIIDYMECYKTTEKDYILVSSPYYSGGPKKYLENGWIPYNKLYLNDIVTYIKIIPIRKKILV